MSEGHLRSPEKTYQDLLGWLERLSTGQVASVERPTLAFMLPEATSQGIDRMRPTGSTVDVGASAEKVVRQKWHHRRQGGHEMVKAVERVAYWSGGLLILSGVIHLAVLLMSGGTWEGPLSLRKPTAFGLSFGLTLINVTCSRRSYRSRIDRERCCSVDSPPHAYSRRS